MEKRMITVNERGGSYFVEYVNGICFKAFDNKEKAEKYAVKIAKQANAIFI